MGAYLVPALLTHVLKRHSFFVFWSIRVGGSVIKFIRGLFSRYNFFKGVGMREIVQLTLGTSPIVHKIRA